MTEDTKIIQQLRNLKKTTEMPNEKKFLNELRIKLSDRISAHSAINPNASLITKYQDGFFTKCFSSANTFFTMFNPRSKSIAGSEIVINKSASIPWYLRFSLANAVIIPHTIIIPQKTIAVFFVICLFGVSGIALASQRSLPGDTLYPIKILSEEIQSSLAYTPESKAIIYTNFTIKRVAEVKAIMEQENINQEILDIALSNLQKNAADAAAVIDEESKKGNNIAKLAKDANDALGKNTNNLNQIFNDKNIDLKKEENSLQDKIEEAKKNNDQEIITSLNNKLKETKNKRKSIENTWDKSKETLHENTHKIENKINEKKDEKESLEQTKPQPQNSDSQENHKNYDSKKKFSPESANNIDGSSSEEKENEESDR